jgi:hypothetical protein
VDELWEEVRKRPRDRDRSHVLSELVQIAAMAQRTAEDLGLMCTATTGTVLILGHGKGVWHRPTT